MKYYVTIQGRTHEVELAGDTVKLDGETLEKDLSGIPGTSVHSLILDGRSWRVRGRRLDSERWGIALGGRRLEAEVVDERTRAIREMTGAGSGPAGPAPVRAPMPGLVVKVEVAPGDRVREGQGVVIVEAMKMENELRAETDAIVSAVHVTPGQTVERNQVLVVFQVPEEGGSDDE
jgi:biotin carboxyl carrier protein